MTMVSERTVWAEGFGFSEELVEALTLIAEDAFARFAQYVATGDERGERSMDLMSRDLDQWAAELESKDFGDLAAKVRELQTGHTTAPYVEFYRAAWLEDGKWKYGKIHDAVGPARTAVKRVHRSRIGTRILWTRAPLDHPPTPDSFTVDTARGTTSI